MVAVDRTRIDQRAAEGNRRAKLAHGVLKRLSYYLGGAQLGISIVSLVLGFLAEPLIASLFRPLLEGVLGPTASEVVSVVIALTIATMAQMVLGELVPKGLAIARAESTTLALAPFLRVFVLVFGPLITALNGTANALIRKLGIEPREELSHVRSLPELAVVIEASAEEGTLAGTASRLLSRSVRFAEKTAADALVPRVAVRGLPRDGTVADVVAAARETGYSRLPVFGADIDDICGIVHVKAAHTVPAEERAVTPVTAVMTDILAVPETRELVDVLADMRGTRNHLVVVVDEYGGTAGILTLEDVVEEIVGDIADEYDPLTPAVAVASRPGEFVVAGSLHPDEVEEATGFEVPEGEYETLAGFVLDRLGHIPEAGERFEHDGWTLEVVALDRRRITEVRLRLPAVGGEQPHDPEAPS